MKHILSFILVVLLSILSAKKLKAQNGWIKLFNGKDLKDWIIKIKDHPMNSNYGNTFRVENGIMKVSYDQYKDFNEQFGHIFISKNSLLI